MGWIRRLRNSWSNSGSSFDEEARFHLDQRTGEFIRAGMSADQARRAALTRFGSVARASDPTADADLFRWLDDFRRDVGYGLRLLRRSRGFALLAILCLTLGIGASAAVFSWIEGILLRPHPLVLAQNRLFAVAGTDRGGSGDTSVSWPDWLDLERGSTLVDAFIAEKITGTTLNIGDRAERAPGSVVSANYFEALGVHPILGRAFVPGEDTGRNAHPVTVVSYQVWQERFHGDPAIIGRTQMLNGLPHTIVGVAPEGFYGTFVGYAFQFWVPASMQPQFHRGVYKLEDRGARWIEGFVRLKPGVTVAQAQAELSAVMARLETAHPETNRGRGIKLFPAVAHAVQRRRGDAPCARRCARGGAGRAAHRVRKRWQSAARSRVRAAAGDDDPVGAIGCWTRATGQAAADRGGNPLGDFRPRRRCDRHVAPRRACHSDAATQRHRAAVRG